MVHITVAFTLLLFSAEPASAIWSDDAEANRSHIKMAGTATELRGIRRVGVGIVAGGLSGMAGINMEINFTRSTAVFGGAGISSDFQSFFLGGKYSFAGSWFQPYLSGAYARWYSSNPRGEVGKTTPGLLAQKFLSAEERMSGKFSESILSGGIGIQYLQIKGGWAGASVYADAQLLADMDDLVIGPTGSLGFIYYF